MKPHRQEKPSTVFDSIRAGFRAVAEQAQHVRIRHDLISAYADGLKPCAPEKVLDSAHHYEGDAESTAAYILILDSINFGSGFETGMVREGWTLVDGSLYYTLSTRLKQYFEQNGAIPADRLAAFTPADCVSLLELSDRGPYSYDFAELCAVALRELGGLVARHYNGSYLSFIDDAGGSADHMVRLLARLPHFRDVHAYHGRDIPFYKRAQITAADLHLAFRRLGRELFSDIGDLTMFADNGVPHVFHIDGLLEYSEALAGRIAKGMEVPSGSDEEIEIRACAGHLVELIAAHKGMIAMDVDHILWHKHVEDLRYRQEQPHRTLSVFY